MEDCVIICRQDLDEDVNSVFNELTLRDDDVLISNILEYADIIKNNGGEIFKHEKNIIATSEGFFFAFYESELNAV